MKDFNTVLDELIDSMGCEDYSGKEYCLRQTISESDHRKYIREYQKTYRDNLLNKISSFYRDGENFSEDNFTEVDINNTIWTQHLFNIYFYDKVNYRFFEFSMKTNDIEEVSLFKFCDDDDDELSKTYPKSFFSKIKGGILLWENYSDYLNEIMMEKREKKLKQKREENEEKMKNFKFLDTDEIDNLKENNELNLEEAPTQYSGGGITRYLGNGEFYYKLRKVNGYVTFGNEVDILLDPSFNKFFYKEVLEKIAH